MRGAGLLLALAVLPAAAPAAPVPGGDTFTVTYRSDTSVYVSAGRAAGLAVGDHLLVRDGEQEVAELEVAFVAEHSSSSRVVKETRPVKVGDRVVRAGGTRAGATVPGTPAPAGSPSAPPSADVRLRARPAALAHVTGGASAGWSGFRDRTGAGRDLEERMARYAFSFRELGGRPLEMVVRGSNRHFTRDGLRTTVVPAAERRDRLYEASLAWTPPDHRFSLRAGRLGASPFPSLGYLDGVLGDFRPAAAVQVGGFAGRTPDAEDVGVPGGAKYGGFVRLAPRGGPVAYDVVFAGVAERAGSEISREYLGQEGHVRAGRLWLHERLEVDLNRGWRKDRAGRGAQLSEARLLAAWRPSASRLLSVSYERRRNFWTAWNRGAGVSVFDDRLHQTLRADLALTRPGGRGMWLGGSVRARETDDRRAYAAHLGVRAPEVFSLAASAETSAYQTAFTRGVMTTIRAGRDLRGGHRADVSYTFDWYDLGGAGAARRNHWLRLSGYGHLGRGAFARGDLDLGLAGDLEGTRFLVEAGYRF